MNKRNVKKFLFYLMLISVVVSIIILVTRDIGKKAFYANPENRKAMTYNELTEQDKKVENCDYVEFSSFFTRDIDRDGYAERLDGTCKEIGDTDTLYAEINVLTQGVLKDAKITLNGENFTWTTAIVEDNFIAEDYIGETSEIKLKDISNGSQKLLWGTIKSKLENNINDYSKVNSVTLTGTYYDEAGRPTKINKTVNLTVDWYSKTETAVNKYYYSATRFTSYQNQAIDIATAITDTSVDLTFKVAISEMKQNLLLQKQVAEITIPELNGYKALEVNVAEKNIKTTYNEETGILTITRESELDENGNLTKTVSKSNINNITIKYPLEAYNGRTTEVIVLNVPIVGYNYIYNNQDKEFDELRNSRAEGILTVTYAETHGEIWNLYTSVGNNERVSGTNTYRYQVSKEQTTNIYNGNTYEEGITTYPVKWEVIVGDYTKINKITLEEDKENQNNKTDKFLNTSGTYSSMYDYIKTTGVYFSNATSILGKEGWIKLYNAETGSLIETFNSDNWGSYTKDKPYNIDLKSIKIETSEPISNTTFAVYQIKEIDDELLSQKLTKEEFEKLSYIYTYVKGQVQAPLGVKYDNGSDNWSLTNLGYAYYEMPYSVAKISITPNEITNQKTESIKFMIDTLSASSMEKKWKNGVFLIELPENIICVNLNDIEISDSKVEITASEILEENGKYFIKVYTRNEEETTYKITIDAEIVANPLETTSTKPIKLYAYNEICNNYYNQTEDIYDISTTDNYVGVSNINITAIAPSGLLTTEYVTDYDDLGNRTIAPNVAEIEKSDEQRTATINVSLTNSYNGTISDMKILGKIPFEGNTYVLNGETLNSQYTANITGEIKVPEKLKKFVKIYYSTNENPTRELDESNNWKTAEEITDWSEIRTYLIDLGKYKLAKEENVIFAYEVIVPAGLGYNQASFSTHGVYFNLDTENGKLSTKTEPNKVGIQVVSKYSMQLTKNKNTYNDTFVQGATYRLTTVDNEGKEIIKTAKTNENGILRFNGIYIEKEYVLKELVSPVDYVLNPNEVKFTTHINENNELIFDILEGEFKQFPEITTDENGNYLVKAQVQDESKYTLIINKTDIEGNTLESVRFLLNGKDKVNKAYKTDSNGIIKITGLYPNETYELQETRADGYYVYQETRRFKVVRNESGVLEFQTNDDIFRNVNIIEESGIAQALVTTNIQNEKIPTYNLQILKVEENLNEENIENLKPLPETSFKLVSRDLGNQKEYKTDENGYINIEGLYEYVEGKYITGSYTLQETKAPDGYANNAEELKFIVSKNSDGILNIDIENQDELTTLKKVLINNNKITLVIEDKPLFKLTKVDSETGTPLADAQFIIYELGENGEIVGYAEDINGIHVGEPNSKGIYVVTTDENGIISLPLKGGTYKAVEVTYPNGYVEGNTVEYFKVAGDRKKNESDEIDVEKIEYIEDLVNLSNKVNSGATTYEGKIVKLMRDLDFTDVNSYRSKTINNNLISGSGFVPIGLNSTCCFSGIFDGNGKKIENLYINSSNYEYIGLFGYIKNANIKRLGMSSGIINAMNYSTVGGIVGRADNSSISYCYNMMNIENVNTSGLTGGIVGSLNESSIDNCYNKGDIQADGRLIGGIAGGGNYSTINSSIDYCYNMGIIIHLGKGAMCPFAGGILGGEYCNISNCYNIGKVNNKYWGAGGIAGEGSNININNCYNKGEISVTGGYENNVGGITANAGNISNCYNIGTVSSMGTRGYVGGITGRYSRGCKNCYNVGDLNSLGTDSYVGGIIGSEISVNGIIEECYYLNTIVIAGNTIIELGIPQSNAYMRSTTFYNNLNTDKVWSYIDGGYPVLNTIMVNLKESTELTVKNSLKKFIVITDVNEVDGIKGGSISGDEDEAYETLVVNESNKKEIKITPESGYGISNITINGETIDYTVKEDGTYTIPAGYFDKIQEDKHVVVTFTPLEQILTINKVDEEDTNKTLEGVKFKVEQIDERSPITNEVGNISVTGGQDASELLGDLTNNNSSYYFVKNGNTYIPNNKGISSSTANSYIKIDLSGKSNTYYVVVNASVSSESNYDVGYATITQNTTAPGYDNSTGQFMKSSGTVSSTNYTSSTLQGGRIYYLHLGYRKDSSVDANDDKITINSIKLYESKNAYSFIESNGKYVSNNQGKDGTVANSYIPIDLTNTTGKYNLKVNAEISSERWDYGYVTITNTRTAPAYNNGTGRLVYISGEQVSQDYTTILTGRNIYYVHFGYYKNSSTSSGTDTFTINSIELSLNTDDFYNEELQTDKFGQIRRAIPSGKYKITETKASEGYILNSEPIIYEVRPEKDNTLTITNQKQRQVVVHHYLKNSDGTYTKVKVAEDEFYEGDIGTDYTTNPHMDLEKLTLEKDNDGKFKRPENASGKYTQEQIEVIYYYEAEPIELKIHHYLNGTQNKLVQDDIIHINPEVKFDENGNYEVVCVGSYSLADNEKYNNLIKQYNLVNLSTTVQENVEIGDTIKYNTDSELSYYYELKEYTITTKVELHPELRTDELTNEKVELLVDGGTISGNGQDKYEVVVRGENSSKEIVITPYEGYTIEKVTLNSINDAGEKTTTILYGENRAIDAEVTCIENEDGSMSLISANSSVDSVFQNVVENKEIIVKLAPKVGTIIVHHYFEETGEEFNTLPERIILLDGTICEDEVKTEIIGESYATKAFDGSEVMYELVSTSGETNGKVTEGEKHVYYYYKRIEQKITTEVIKHEEIDESGNTMLVKGGSISGENEEPYETVLKFDDSTKEIKIIPEETYQIKKVLINGEEISLDKILDDKSLILDKFESVDKDIHVAVEFEKIPTKVIIKYIDEETEKEISKQDIIEGIINTSYETNSKTIEGYELLENKLPENVKGIMTEDDIIVIYYYKKVKAPVEEPTKEPTEKPTEDKPTENPNKPENEPKEEEPGKDYETPERKEEEKTTTPEIQNQSNLPKVLIKTGQSRAMVIGLVIIITSSIIVIIVINKKQK